MHRIQDVLARGAVRSEFQPIVDLVSGDVVAHEALARGPEGPLQTPDALFAAARGEGLLAELDQLCRAAAFRGALAQEVPTPLTVFVNVEPEVLDTAPVDELLALVDSAPGRLRIVLEITERALSARPAELLRTVGRVRDLGWAIALDDVGADSASLAFMPLLRPEVVKLDLRVVQERPSPDVAAIVNAVNDYAERTGALLLAEGIETEAHLATARGLGASLGQGWLFGRAVPAPEARPQVGELRFPPPVPRPDDAVPPSPFACLPPGTELKHAPKRLLVELSRQLERQAVQLGKTCVVAATFQEARHVTPRTIDRYRELAAATAFVCALGHDVVRQPLPGVRGAALEADDPVRAEWDVVVVSPHFAAALLARDLGDVGVPDMDRRFEYALTYRRQTVLAAAHSLLLRVAPDGASTLTRVPRSEPAPPAGASAGEPPLHRALRAATSGITIADLRRPGHPLVFANQAYADLAGQPLGELVGRSARHLDGGWTDRAAVDRLVAAVADGRKVRETLLQHRGPDRTPWWSEVQASPVVDERGRVVQCITVHTDVTRTRERGQAPRREGRGFAGLPDVSREGAGTDALTGLLDRHRFHDLAERELRAATGAGTGTALLSVGLDGPGVDGFGTAGDAGRAAADLLLVSASRRLQSRLRRSDLAGRLGPREFLVALVGLDRDTARAEAGRIAAHLGSALSAPYRIGGHPVDVSVSIGVSSCPGDEGSLGRLVVLAGDRMRERQEARRRAPVLDVAGEPGPRG
ncbi:EAL domain-containing protein [Kineococcus rubinsiae]|uniref:EAL domain-containing protein n=1 Tax=Kineococcus rubinsiae TaxID=2609562 RepID=UPI001431A180|nr:EAL domain-containing protein [Kineococcus rubinsiae]NIZ90774.1 EAL domain-containing protein [Kineococcus rubinsiae]